MLQMAAAIQYLRNESDFQKSFMNFAKMLKKVKVFLSYLAFIVSYGALSALPPWVAATGALFVFTV